ncbi:MAG: HD domain-containing protein [Coriobacteriales bacterium]|nr:HD domain-containing protein [Coriobacteriales bacterium]
MDNQRLAQQLAFALQIDDEKNVLRQTLLSNHGRRENDAEHAWHMTVMAYLLREYSNEPIDIARTMIMTLTHDLVEIFAGDTYAYDAEGQKTAATREAAAADQLFGMLPADQAEEFRAIWEEFEQNQTPEARFAHAMDNVQPIMLNDSNDGESWRIHDVARSGPAGRNALTRQGSTTLADYVDELLDKHVAAGNLRP